MAIVGDEKDGEGTLRKEGPAIGFAVHDDRGCEIVHLVGRDAFPELTGEGDVAQVDVATGFAEQPVDECLVHRRLAAVGVEMSGGELDGLAQHHAEGNAGNTELMGHAQGLTDIVAVFDEGLLGKVGVEGLDEAFALGSTIDDDALCSRGFCHLHAPPDALDEGLLGEGLDDARDADDGDAAFDAEAGIEGATGYLLALGG